MQHRSLILVVLCCLFSLQGIASPHKIDTMPEETLSYKVMFKWGLINKKAGHASLMLRHGNDCYEAKLAAASEPWADKFFMVRDTLNGKMAYTDMMPLFYEKIAHEGTDDKHDKVFFCRKPDGSTSATCYRKEIRKGVQRVDEQKEMTSDGAAIDMLSSFYYMRNLPYESWIPGHNESIDIFSGKRKELLSIRYNGIVDVEVDGISKKAYHITFIFTSGGGKKTSDDMEAWIATDGSRIPLRLEGKLPVGKVHCILTGKGK